MYKKEEEEEEEEESNKEEGRRLAHPLNEVITSALDAEMNNPFEED